MQDHRDFAGLGIVGDAAGSPAFLGDVAKTETATFERLQQAVSELNTAEYWIGRHDDLRAKVEDLKDQWAKENGYVKREGMLASSGEVNFQPSSAGTE